MESRGPKKLELGGCPFPNGSVFTEKTWNHSFNTKSSHISKHRALMSSSWVALTMRKLPYRTGEGKEWSVQKRRLKALGPQLLL